MRLDQQIREAKMLQDQMPWLREAKMLQDQMPWLREAKMLQDQMPWLREAKMLQDQMPWLREAKMLQDQMPWLREAKMLQDQMPWLREAKTLQDQLPQVDTVLDQIARVNNTVLDQMARVNNTVLDQMARVNNTVLDQMARSQVDTVLDQIARVNNTVLDQMARSQVDTVLDQIARVNNTVLDQMARVNTFGDRWSQEFKTFQDVEDRISKLTNFSQNLFPFVEKYAEELLKEEAVSEQKMTDEVKKQTEDLFRELENEEVADGVEFLERFRRKVVEVPNKMPDWLKGCLIMIIWDTFKKYLLPCLYVVFGLQIAHQTTVPTTIVHKPVTAIIKKAERQGLHLPSGYRIVIARVLNVRARPTRHSDIRGRLLAGDLVVIKKKKKNWSLVEYSNEETRVKIQGWVFTRYLRKIN